MKKKIGFSLLVLIMVFAFAVYHFQGIGHNMVMEDCRNVSYECELGKISFELPGDWKYSVSEYDEKEGTFGISFWPKGEKEGKFLISYVDMFGVCGTGLDQKEVRFDNGKKARVGTYDNHEYWDFIHFTDGYEHYVVTVDGEMSWQKEYDDQVMNILNTLELGDK
ncbi:MAG: hypothetical protein Q4E73_04190 [Lachnospiraceae bacterium]|nr:hypothetical protein [Lachnospiraceae bacterium]